MPNKCIICGEKEWDTGTGHKMASFCETHGKMRMEDIKNGTNKIKALLKKKGKV